MRYNIEESIEGDFDDYYASYDLVAEGNTLEELIADAHIFEVGQDGDSLRDYPLEDARTRLEEVGLAIINEYFNNNKPDISHNGDN